MATINSCTSCGCNKAKCGCQDTMLTSPAPCPTPIGCPSPEPCSEVFDAQCVIYTGDTITCDTDVIITTNTNVPRALESIVDYFCDVTSQIIPITSFRAVTGAPQNINFLPSTLANAFIGNGNTITNLTVGYQLVDNITTTQYAPVTGQWTCPQTGKYDINYNVYLSAPNSVTGPGQFGWGENGGSIQIGVTTTNGLSTYLADIISLPVGVPFLRIYGTGVLQGVQLTAGSVIVLKILNLSGINYTSVSGDNIDWSIRRVG